MGINEQIDKEKKQVREIVLKIVELEKIYPQSMIKKACIKYNVAIVEKVKAEKEIKALEIKLAQAKRKLQ